MCVSETTALLTISACINFYRGQEEILEVIIPQNFAPTDVRDATLALADYEGVQ